MSSIRSVVGPLSTLTPGLPAVSGLHQQVAVTKFWWCLIVVVSLVSNAALLIAQQVAIRLMAPLIGSSIETWSAILGVFLMGIAIGNWISGKLADRYSPTTLLVTGLLLGSGSMYVMPFIVDWIADAKSFALLALEVQILSAAFSVCLLPGMTLSLITPPSIRSLVHSANEIGSVSGRIFAWGTLGSLLGNYLTGFVLLAMFGTRVIVDATSLALLLMAVIVHVVSRFVTRQQRSVREVVTAGPIPQRADTVNLAIDSAKAGSSGSWYPRALITVVACSFVSGALEGAAFRILAPLVGVSMFLSAGVVGVILAGMASGNALGGRIASRCGSFTALRNSLAACAAGTLAAAFVLMFVCKSPYDRESKYFSLAVTDDVVDHREVKMLVLDRLVHSAIDLSDPEFLHYPHERVQGELTKAAASQARAANQTSRILVIGGGGYSFPRWVEAQSDLKDLAIDVVEIDPAVTEMAYDKLGLSRQTRIVSIHMDGRQFVKSAPAASYDLVIQDAVNDLSVPWHLMTNEYNQLIRRLLRPEGMYLLTVIDDVESGRFLASAVRTMGSAFSETELLAPQETKALRSRSVFIISGHNRKQTPGLSEPADSAAWWKDRSSAHVFPEQKVNDLLERWGSASPLLTDDYAPVDILMSSHFLATSVH